MNPKHIITSILLTSVLFITNTAMAGSESGLYIGGSIGQATVKASGQTPGGDDFNYNEDDGGYKIFIGYNFGVIPLVDLAVEGSYVDFGNPSSTLPGGEFLEVDLTGWDAFGLAALTFGPFSVFGKMGLISWDSDVTLGNIPIGSNSDTDPAYGLGAKLILGSLALRAEYEYFDIGDFSDVYMASVGLSYTF
jgi:outer membrane immunogenic protein